MKWINKFALNTIIVLVFVVMLSCSKDDSNPAGPTVEVKITGSLSVDYFPYPGSTLQIHQNILKADLLFDGNVVASANYAYESTFADLTSTVSSAKKGTHSISFRITNQGTSPYYYHSSGKVTAGNSTYDLPDKKAQLATGESISYSVTID